MRLDLRFAGILSLFANAVCALEVDWTDDGTFAADMGDCLKGGGLFLLLTLSTESIKTAASSIAYNLMRYYSGNNTGDVPGNLPSPYFCA